ncbi:RNA recognition motif 2-domain-containing protein [Emericellopsis atlantica]|uniref:RNA recognition motif 2-domain-containing protein n=1 Tax=Emericellopsis atlantica TaxID=2614577 RepID=A0A9P7ZJA0_9HYPO|nr:RNA recognition motif 2-domain-containing protein [Emericellopsis atlantica]KAG9252741.1 RNA recognition motif 2-domain-containing protein [Emericellopsis atlantica]
MPPPASFTESTSSRSFRLPAESDPYGSTLSMGSATWSPNSMSKTSYQEKTEGHIGSATPTSATKCYGDAYRGNMSTLERDPFTTPGRSKGLSPTASAFEPILRGNKRIHYPIGNPIAAGLSTDLGLSRFLSISHSLGVSVPDVEAWLTACRQIWFNEKYIASPPGHVLIQFEDIRDACSVHASARLGRKSWTVRFISPEKMPEVAVLAAVPTNANIPPQTSIELVKSYLQQHGQLFAFVHFSTFQDGSFRAVAEFCSVTASICALGDHGGVTINEGIHLTITPYGTSNLPAGGMLDILPNGPANTCPSGTNMADMPMEVVSHQTHQVPATDLQHTAAMYPPLFQPQYSPSILYTLDCVSTMGQNTPTTPITPRYPMGTMYQTPPSPAPTSNTHHSPSRSGQRLIRPDVQKYSIQRLNRSPHRNGVGHHNHVDIQHIRDGMDVRTTIMLRNIPNKVDQAMLKRIVDESSWGKYDFMYLRIDFANDCNVGYAFINFVDRMPSASERMLTQSQFVDARGNQRWNCFKSDKVAEVSYATIQGKDCLVQKFRNSSVMLEAAHYRPKLYFTSNGPMPELAGQEEPFPEPDNQSKMKRSCENAEHVGKGLSLSVRTRLTDLPLQVYSLQMLGSTSGMSSGGGGHNLIEAPVLLHSKSTITTQPSTISTTLSISQFAGVALRLPLSIALCLYVGV